MQSIVRNSDFPASYDLDMLERAYCQARSQEEKCELEQAIKERGGPDHFHHLDAACLFVSRVQSSADYGKVRKAREFFARHQALGLSPFQLRGCRTVEQMEGVLALQSRLAGGDLEGFYQGGVSLLGLGGCSVIVKRGMWEVLGGTALHLLEGEEELIKVGGYFRWKECRPETTVVSIQGTQGTQAAQGAVWKRLGIHPGNALLLLYLQVSRLLGQKRVRIRSSASVEYNQMQEDSDLYLIPRNYFRLKADAETGLYQLDAAQRDRILDKFSGKHAILADAFADLSARL
ncbi:MAG TPA: hypothetical protein VLU25_11810 [Acidobacteriota bacterium]|nr:hypothetical protein [Acidobacteriota bacterium]